MVEEIAPHQEEEKEGPPSKIVNMDHLRRLHCFQDTGLLVFRPETVIKGKKEVPRDFLDTPAIYPFVFKDQNSELDLNELVYQD